MPALNDLFDRFLASEEKNLKPSTLASYRWYWRKFFLAGMANTEVKRVRTVELQNQLTTIASEWPELTHQTFVRMKSLLSSLFAFAVREGIRDDNPAKAVRVPRGRRSLATTAVTAAELSRALELLSGASRVAVGIAGFSGLRAGEIGGLRWSDYDDVNGLLWVRRSRWRGHETEPKTNASQAAVPVIAQLAAILSSAKKELGATGAIDNANAHVISQNLANLVERRIKPVFAAASPPLPWRGWHAYRRFFGTELYRSGASDSTVAKALRHTSVAIARAHYIKTSEAEIRGALDAAFR